MDYLIKFAKKGAVTLMLGKNGNRYYVSSWDSVNERSPIATRTFERFDNAEPVFEALRKEYGFGEAEETKFEFDYINID